MITLHAQAQSGFYVAIDEDYGLVINPQAEPAQDSPLDYILLTHWEKTLWDNAVKLSKAKNAIIVIHQRLSDFLESLPQDETPPSVMMVESDQEIELPWGRLVALDNKHDYTVPNQSAPYQGNGYMLISQGHHLYHAGLTSMDPSLRDVGKMYKPDLAMVPVSAEDGPYLSGEGLCQAVMWLGSDIILPTLFEPLNDEDLQEIFTMVDIYSPAMCRFLEPGATYELEPIEESGRTAGPEARY